MRSARSGPGAALAGLALVATGALAGCVQLDPDVVTGHTSANQGRLGDSLGLAPGLPPPPPWIGAWLGTWPSAQNHAIEDFRQTSGLRLDVVDVYVSWDTPPEDVSGALERVMAAGARPLVTWMPAGLTTPQIAAGTTPTNATNERPLTVDAYVSRFARIACDAADLAGRPILLRPMPDPNGDWHTWSVGWHDPGGAYPNTPDTYREAWAHVHAVFTRECPAGAEFIWSINHASIGPGTGDLNAYPEPSTVDHVGINGFNWGDAAAYGWVEFDALYSRAYCNVTRGTGKPVILTALGSAESGGDKSAWMRVAFDRIATGVYDVEGVVWFHDRMQFPGRPAPTDFRVNSSDATLATFRETAQALQRGTLVTAAATWDICPPVAQADERADITRAGG